MSSSDGSRWVAAKSEKNLILGIQTQANGPGSVATKLIMRSHLERVHINDRDLVFIFEVNIEMAVTIAGGLRRSATKINGAHKRTVFGVRSHSAGCG